MNKIPQEIILAANNYTAALLSLNLLCGDYYERIQQDLTVQLVLNSENVDLKSCYEYLIDPENIFIKFLKKQDAYQNIIDLFIRSKCKLDDKHKFLIELLPKEIVLYVIIAASLCSYDRVLKYGANHYVVSQEEEDELKDHAKEMLDFFNNKIIGLSISVGNIEFLETISRGKINTMGHNLREHDSLISIAHPTAARTIFLITFGRVYRRYFISESGANTVPATLLTAIAAALIDTCTDSQVNQRTIERCLIKYGLN